MASSLEILNLAASEGDKILLVATPNVDQNQLLTLKNTFVNQVSTSGVVAFEQLERVAVSPLPKGNYTAIYSNLIQPSVETHSTNTLQKFLETLAPGGSLTLRELVLTSFLPPAACPVNRTSQSLASTLKLAGFIDVTVRFVDTIPDTDLVDYFHAWGATRVEQGIEVLGGKLAVATVVARKPAYEVGQKMALNFTKISTQPNKTSTQPPRRPKVVWTILDDDNDDVELEDEDDLLDETDKVKPSKESLARPDDCELVDGKRKACKNCTCSRGSMLEDDDIDLTDGSLATSAEPEIVEVDPTPKKTACGSCALGDAFRCFGCPYLGIPAFGEGEKVVLTGAFGSDDIEI